MFISKVYESLSNTKKEDFVGYLIVGLVGGMVAGMIAGMFTGLFVGLVAGMFAGMFAGLFVGMVAGRAAGLFAGLVAGMFAGMVSGLFAGLVAGLVNFNIISPFSLWSILLFVFIVSNLISFFLRSNKKLSYLEWLFKIELLGFIEVLTITINALNVRYLLLHTNFRKYLPNIIHWIGIIGIIIVCLTILTLILYGKYKLYNINLKKRS